MSYDFKGVKRCGAKCRTKNGGPCAQPAMKNGRCKMHGGMFYKKETHGRTTLRAKAIRKEERTFLRDMKQVNKEIEEIINERPH